MNVSAAIIGGGISGLAAGYRLRELVPTARITVFESGDRFGGKIRTDRIDSLISEGGADAFLNSKSRGRGLSQELGLENREVSPNPANRGAFVLKRGKLMPLPEGISGLLTLRVAALFTSRLISPLGKLRILLEVFVSTNTSNDDETVKSFFTRRVGHEYYANVVEPLVAGIYGGNGANLSLIATFAQWRTAERTHGSLTRAMLAARRENAHRRHDERPRSGFTSYKTGLSEMVERLVERLTARSTEMRPNTHVEAIGACDPDGKVAITFRDEAGSHSEQFDTVILAVSAAEAARLVAPLDRATSDALAEIPLGSSALVTLSFLRRDVQTTLRGTGYIAPSRANRPVMAMSWMSSKWKDRAPEDQILIRAFIGRDNSGKLLDRDDNGLIDIVREELRELHDIGAEPVITRVYRWDRSMPQYIVGHVDRVRKIETGIHQLDGIEIAGNFLRGVGIPDCIASGELAAANAASGLRERARIAGS